MNRTAIEKYTRLSVEKSIFLGFLLLGQEQNLSIMSIIEIFKRRTGTKLANKTLYNVANESLFVFRETQKPEG